MSVCPMSASCPFYSAVQPSITKRIRFGSARRYCIGGRHESCALHPYVARGHSVPVGLLPTGGRGDYQTVAKRLVKVLVVDDSPIFTMIARNAVIYHMPHASVTQCHTYEEAASLIKAGHFETIVTGYGLGSGRTAHDLRRLTETPLVILTGRPEDQVEAPSNSRVVQKGTGPEALRVAIGASLAR